MRVWTTILAAVSMLCFCAAWASANNGTNLVVAVTQSAKMAAEKGDPAAQFRYAEMLWDGHGVARKPEKGTDPLAMHRTWFSFPAPPMFGKEC